MSGGSYLTVFRLVCFYNIAAKGFALGWVKWLPNEDTTRAALAVRVLACIAAVLLNYGWELRSYHQARKTVVDGEAHLPPRYPSQLPFLGNVVPFLADSANFMYRVGTYAGNLVSTRVPFLGRDVYVVQDRETIKKVAKHPALTSPMDLYIFSLKYMFGMPKAALEVYRKDDSGPLAKPYPGSNVAPADRIDYMLHQNFLRQWSGPNLSTTTQRFKRGLESRIDALGFSDEWTTIDDFYSLLAKVVSAALVESIFGPSLLRLNPGFIDDLWQYDDAIPWLARGIPWWIMPRPYRLRDSLRDQIKKWYAAARRDFTESSIEADGDGDPYWGSAFVRYLQKTLSEGGHDDASLSAQDLGTIWAANSNTTPSTCLAALHIFRDPALLQRIRASVDAAFPTPQDLIRSDPKQLLKQPLLCSVFAETLRLYVKVFFAFSSPHQDVSLGRYRLPRAQLGLWNSDLAHMDERFWNTRGGKFPVTEFWAGRFLVDERDPGSGPVREEVRAREGRNWAAVEEKAEERGAEARERGGTVRFSTEGLDGSWVPYGAGIPICPGRLLSKNVILHTCAYMVRNFDVEILTPNMQINNWRYGLGVGRPAHNMRARIRKRTA